MELLLDNKIDKALEYYTFKSNQLKDKMNTTSGKKIAESRHQFMETYLQQFYDEWNGKL